MMVIPFVGNNKDRLTLVVDLSISVDISLADHFVDLFIGQLLTQVCHNVSEFGGRDEAVAILIEDPESFSDLLFRIRVFHFPGHHRKELREVDRPVSVRVDFVYHVLQLSFRRVLAQTPHHSSQLFGGDGSVTILIEQRKRFLEFCFQCPQQLVTSF